MMTSTPIMDCEDSQPHRLLGSPALAYSNLTVRRAFIVWLHLGQTNKFKDVCNYYHYLEGLEETLTVEQRIASRHHEFQLFSNPPPNDRYLQNYFPTLYPDVPVEPQFIEELETIRNETPLFKLEGFNQIKQRSITQTELNQVSQIIRKYCCDQRISLRRFLDDFKKYTETYKLKKTVSNVVIYIKQKLQEAELVAIANPPDLSFIHSLINNDDSYYSNGNAKGKHPTSYENGKEERKISNGINKSVTPKSKIDNHERRYEDLGAAMNNGSPVKIDVKTLMKHFDQKLKQKSLSVDNILV